MVFTDEEMKGCVKMLKMLPTESIMSLANTVTKKGISAENKLEAIQAIIAFSESPEWLLKRQRITRDLLMQYAFSESISVSGSADKSQLILVLKNYWKPCDTSIVARNNTAKINPSVQINCGSTVRAQATHPTWSSERAGMGGGESRAKINTSLQINCGSTVRAQATHQTWSSERAGMGGGESRMLESHSTNIQVNFQTPPNQLEGGDLKNLGLTFSKWFYNLLNSQNSNKCPYFGAEHFWPDSVLYLNVATNHQNYSETVEGAEMTACKLRKIVTEEKLYFNANIEGGGVATKIESFGFICVLVHGTVHRDVHCLGLFEQAFSLIRDPALQNNWKIKHIKLTICSK